MTNSSHSDPPVLEPEVLPPNEGRSADDPRPPEPGTTTARPPRGITPLLAGMLLDLLDLLTAGPVGVSMGFVLGGGIAYWLGSLYELPRRQRWLLALAAGAYCTMPVTELVPLGTIIGAYLNFREPTQEPEP